MALESAYIAQLNPMEKKILQIAISHLETSFSLNKSIGFQEWQAKQAQAKQAQAKQAQAKQIQEPKVQTQEPQVQIQEPQAQEPQAQEPQAQEPQLIKKPPPLLIKRKIKIKLKPS